MMFSMRKLIFFLLLSLGLCAATRNSNAADNSFCISASKYDDRHLDFVLITDDTHLYDEEALAEDGLLMGALQSLSYVVERRSYQDTEFDWSTTKVAFLRSAWDRSEDYENFLDFYADLNTKTVLINPHSVYVWNDSKSDYLSVLNKRYRINIPISYYFNLKRAMTLAEISKRTGWDEFVFKPDVGQSGFGVEKVTQENIEEKEIVWQQLIEGDKSERDFEMIVQEFQHSIQTRGEIALIFIAGVFSYATLKVPGKNDFRVHTHFGGTEELYAPTVEEVAFGERVMDAVKSLGMNNIVLNRVDIFYDNNDKLALMEVTAQCMGVGFRIFPKGAIAVAAALDDFMVNEYESQRINLLDESSVTQCSEME